MVFGRKTYIDNEDEHVIRISDFKPNLGAGKLVAIYSMHLSMWRRQILLFVVCRQHELSAVAWLRSHKQSSQEGPIQLPGEGHQDSPLTRSRLCHSICLFYRCSTRILVRLILQSDALNRL